MMGELMDQLASNDFFIQEDKPLYVLRLETSGPILAFSLSEARIKKISATIPQATFEELSQKNLSDDIRLDNFYSASQYSTISLGNEWLSYAGYDLVQWIPSPDRIGVLNIQEVASKSFWKWEHCEKVLAYIRINLVSLPLYWEFLATFKWQNTGINILGKPGELDFYLFRDFFEKNKKASVSVGD